MTKLTFSRDATTTTKGALLRVFAAPASFFTKNWLTKICPDLDVAALNKAAKAATPSGDAVVLSTLTGLKAPEKLVAVVLADDVSRHNAPCRAEALATGLAKAGIAGKDKVALVLGLDDASHYLGTANAVGRNLPLFTRKAGKKKTEGSLKLGACDRDGKGIAADVVVKETTAAARWAAWAIDSPTADMTTAIFAREAKKLVKGLANVRCSEIVGNKLLDAGLGGLHAVGRTAVVAPRLLVLDYRPKNAKHCYALVGKGVVYDTGGLSLKIGGNMCEMKSDMGGGAAVVGAFRTLAATGFKQRLICAVPLAENAIGPDSYRNDDIITMHSKKTVEINNTDAEGRLLLGDAVSYVSRAMKAELVVDAATLTGAQLISSGLRHASLVSNREGLESRAISVGRSSGDLTHALLFAPEFFQEEFASKVADMRNSVANRMNAQSSCAAQFIYAQIDDVDPAWLHIDLAGPAFRSKRGTGYGVALISQLLRELKPADLK